MLIKNDKERIIRLMNELFRGMYFESYRFNSAFTLCFSRENSNNILPLNMNLYLEDWRFGTKDFWETRESFYKDHGIPFIEESLQAFELTTLKCSDDAVIRAISLNNKALEIYFNSGHQLSISCAPMMDSSWTLIGTPSHDTDPERSLWSVNPNDWSFTCEDGEYFARIPDSANNGNKP